MKISTVSLFAATLVACGPGSTTLAPPIDVHVAIPVADPSYVDLVGAEQVIAPGEAKMFCSHASYDGDELAFNNLKFLQGKWGHHVVVLLAKTPKPAGTIESCITASDMAKFDIFGITGTPLPAGYGQRLPKGTKLVLQSHYINTSTSPILVRDAVRIHTLPIADVRVWGAPFVMNNMAMKIMPRQTTSALVTDCVVPVDIEIMQVLGHMHEWGTAFETLIGPDTANLRSIYKVTEWKPEHRDAPPVTLMYSAPIRLPKGSVIRTSCSWSNTTDQELTFPDEMCATVGYANGLDAPWDCSILPD